MSSTTVELTDPRALGGRWSLRRRLHDRRSGHFGRATGELIISVTTDGALWQERGQLAWPGYAGQFTRTLRSELIDGAWWMTFADGRPFHPWTPGRLVRHPCLADLYEGIVDLGPDRLRTQWDVSGPAKDQRILTVFHRVPTANHPGLR